MMVLADTSVWVDHFRGRETSLAPLLTDGSILTHRSVLCELACGNLPNRSRTLAQLSELPSAIHAEDVEVMDVIERKRLYGLGIGWIDAHLIASALLSDCVLWSLDGKLKHAARLAGLLIY